MLVLTLKPSVYSLVLFSLAMKLRDGSSSRAPDFASLDNKYSGGPGDAFGRERCMKRVMISNSSIF